jgi:hypothetical protein
MKLPDYFFFLGFLTSFFGPLSLAIVESSLMGDYNRLLRASNAAPEIPRTVSAAPSSTTIGRPRMATEWMPAGCVDLNPLRIIAWPPANASASWRTYPST